MKIRPAKLSDAPNIAKLGTRAFAQDPSYGHFYPWRQQYPEDFYQKLLYNYKLMIVTPGEVIMVVELDDEDEMESTENLKEVEHQGIVGYATFRRSGGTEEEHAKWNADSTSKGTSNRDMPVLQCGQMERNTNLPQHLHVGRSNFLAPAARFCAQTAPCVKLLRIASGARHSRSTRRLNTPGSSIS